MQQGLDDDLYNQVQSYVTNDAFTAREKLAEQLRADLRGDLQQYEQTMYELGRQRARELLERYSRSNRSTVDELINRL